MIKKYFAKTSLFLIFTLVFPSFIIAEGFIENKGQFLSNVIAKKNVFGGALFIEKAKLSDVCSRIVLKVLFCARIARPDHLQSVSTLAREVTRWTQACDRC